MDYNFVDADLLSAFPELASANQQLLDEWRGEKPGQYILFEDVFARYIEHLLAARPSPVRDNKLRRVFEFIELMLADGGEVGNLGFVGMLEGRSDSWLQAAKPFLGPLSEAALDEYNPKWREQTLRGSGLYRVEAHDSYGVGEMVQQLLGEDYAT